MRSKILGLVFILCLSPFLCPVIYASKGGENQKRQAKRFEVLEKQLHLVVEKGLISLKTRDGDLGSILSRISKGTGTEIEIPPNLQSKVSVAFKSLPLEAALNKLVSNWGIVFSKKKETGGRGISKVFCLAKSKNEGLEKRADREVLTGQSAKYFVETPPQTPVFQNSPDHLSTVGSLSENEAGTMAPHEVIVRFRKDVSRNRASELIKESGASVKTHIAALDYYVLSLPFDMGIKDALNRFREQGGIELAEPNYLIPIKVLPNDHDFSGQWSLDNIEQYGGTRDADINAPEAWEIETGSEEVIIAVVDTGVDYTHPDLSGNIWHNPGEIPNNGIDDDGNGYVDDAIGWDFVDATGGAEGEDFEAPDNNPMDKHGHGTHVAGIAGAVADNGIGIAGVSWRSKIMPLRAGFKTSSGDGVLESDDAARAIIYAADNGARVINLSWGDYQESSLVEDAVSYATNKGALVCAASGNENTSNPIYPAAYDNQAIIAVGATDSEDHQAPFSNYGEWVDVFAPGMDIHSTYPGNTYREMSGTSMAAPHVSGLAALLFSHQPDLTSLEVKARIMRSSDVLTDLAGKCLTSGRINAYSALTDLAEEPHIFSLHSATAHEGDRISIFGEGFDQVQGIGSVIFDSGQKGEIISWSNTMIVCRVPEGAKSGEVVVNTEKGTSNRITIIILPTFYDETLVENGFLGKGKAQSWQADDQSWFFQLPFSFPFFGKQYDSVHVSSNGFLHFSDEPVPYSNNSETLKERIIIAPLWEDLITNGSAQQGEDIYIHSPSPDSICIRWKAETYETGDPVNAEVVFYQDGRILFNYGTGNAKLSPTIGISGGDGAQFHLGSYDGNSSLTQIQTIIFSPHEKSFTITLDPGWNLISLPIEPSTNQVDQIMGSIASKIESVWGFSGGVWQIYMPDDPGMSTLETMKSGYGYWVKAREAGMIQVHGVTKTDPVDLRSGWNLIGIRSAKAVPSAETLAGLEGQVASLWGYKDGKWALFDSQYPGLSDLEMLEPGMGYWARIVNK